MGNKVFVTGGSGFIGSALVRQLLQRGHKVSCLCRPGAVSAPDGAETLRGDILDARALSDRLGGVDVVYHCAARITFQKADFDDAYRVNVEGTRNLLEAAIQAGVSCFVHLSACAVLGLARGPGFLVDESACPEISRENTYAYTKLMAENVVQEFHRKGLHAAIANIATVYGQGDRHLNSGSIIKRILEGRLQLVPPGGTSFVSVVDVARGLISIAEAGRSGERYILCAGNMTYRQLVTRAASALGVPVTTVTVPRIFFYPGLGAMKLMERIQKLRGQPSNLATEQVFRESFGYKYFNSDKARTELGWEPQQDFPAAVQEAYDYYRKSGLM